MGLQIQWMARTAKNGESKHNSPKRRIGTAGLPCLLELAVDLEFHDGAGLFSCYGHYPDVAYDNRTERAVDEPPASTYFRRWADDDYDDSGLRSNEAASKAAVDGLFWHWLEKCLKAGGAMCPRLDCSLEAADYWGGQKQQQRENGKIHKEW